MCSHYEKETNYVCNVADSILLICFGPIFHKQSREYLIHKQDIIVTEEFLSKQTVNIIIII